MLTVKSKYAVIAILEIMSNKSDKPIRLSEISIRQKISLNYLEQIFLKLKKAGIVRSIKGPGGGYYLNSVDSLKIINIIDAVEENTKLTTCSVNSKCKRSSDTKCATHYLWNGLSCQIRNYFSSIAVKDLISEKLSLV